jgi:hypothetical protein
LAKGGFNLVWAQKVSVLLECTQFIELPNASSAEEQEPVMKTSSVQAIAMDLLWPYILDPVKN